MKLYRVSHHDSKGRWIRRTYYSEIPAIEYYMSLRNDPLAADEKPRFIALKVTHKG